MQLSMLYQLWKSHFSPSKIVQVAPLVMSSMVTQGIEVAGEVSPGG